MKEPVIVDSACLIGLERINHLDLLPALFASVIAPPEVQREFGRSLTWLQNAVPTNQSLIAQLRTSVDAGEAEAIALAHELGHIVILDDQQARNVGTNLGLRVGGTLGLLIRAKTAGVIPAVKPLIVMLEANGFYLSQTVKKTILLLAGE